MDSQSDRCHQSRLVRSDSHHRRRRRRRRYISFYAVLILYSVSLFQPVYSLIYGFFYRFCVVVVDGVILVPLRQRNHSLYTPK